MSPRLTCVIEPLESRIAPAFAALLDLAVLSGGDGFRINGVAGDDYAGYSVSGAGDINGDGFDDLIVGASGADPAGNESSGITYVIFGNAGAFATPLNLSTLDGSNGFRINGLAEGDYVGRAVSAAGDVNGDGFDDLAIGALGALPGNAYARGASYVVFGKRNGFGASLDVATLDGSNGFKINGEADGEYAGFSVSGAGDVNGDGLDDLLIGVSDASAGGDPYTGAAYVVFGKKRGFSATFNLAGLNGDNGFKINGEQSNDYAGSSVSAAGDVNGDGFDDILVGAYGADDSDGARPGAAYLVFGRAAAFPDLVDLANLNGVTGLKIVGESGQDYAGISVSDAGDVNGDGFDDIIIGAPGADGSGESSGTSYVVFGRRNGFSATFALSALNGANGFAVRGVAAGDNLGQSVSAAGDINDDGFDDVIMGAPGTGGPGAGAAYVILGKSGLFLPRVDLGTLDGASGFQLKGESEGDGLGSSVSSSGDINGDGFDDLLLGAPLALINGEMRGAAYVVFGRSSNPDVRVGDAEVVEDNSGSHPLAFAVSLDVPSVQPVTVTFSIAGNNATTGLDFLEPSSSALTFAPGELTKTIFVDVLGDTEIEPNETLGVHLISATNAGIAHDTAIGSILNDDDAIRINDAAVVEGDATNSILSFSVTLDEPSVLPVTVLFAAMDGTAVAGDDYAPVLPSMITFAPGETSRAIAISVIADTTSEDDETFNVVLFDALNATIADGSAFGTIINDETRLRISDANALEHDDGTSLMTFSVILTSPHTQPVTVDYLIVDGTANAAVDYTAAATGQLVFAPGQTVQELSVTINGDRISEPAETFSVLLTHSTNAAIEIGAGLGTIINDDGAIIISDVSALEGHSGQRSLSFTVSLTAPSALPIEVDFAFLDGTASAGKDYLASPSGKLLFAPGETAHAITAEIISDTEFEATETFSVLLSGAINARIEDATALGTILNDDVAILGARRARFTDVDGDIVTIRASKGFFAAANFVLVPSGIGEQLALVALNGDSAFQDADFEITAERVRGGNGRVNVGYIDASGIGLGHVVVDGDLARLDAGDFLIPQHGVLSLRLGSLGGMGLTTQLPGGALQSDIHGSLGKLRIDRDISNAALVATGDIGSMFVGGNIVDASIHSDAQIGLVRIGGNLIGSGAAPATISALGMVDPQSTREAAALGGIRVRGSVSHAEILAGYDHNGAALNADVRIGKIAVRHDWIASSVVAGALAGDDALVGTDDDVRASGGNEIVARIASIIVHGAAVGTPDETDHFGIVSEQLTLFKVDGSKTRIAPGAHNDSPGTLVSPTNDFSLLEVL